jgi:hypothetical protein
LLHKEEDANQADYAIIHIIRYKRSNKFWKAVEHIYDNCVMQNRLMKKLLVVL